MTAMPECGKIRRIMQKLRFGKHPVSILWAIFLFSLAPYAFGAPSDQPAESGMQATIGLGYEYRGSSGRAGTLYAGFTAIQPVFQFRSACALDAFRLQRGEPYIADFRSLMVETGTGKALTGPFSLLFRVQYERFSAPKASIFSVIPRIAFDTRHFFITTGMNVRTFSLDDGNPFNTWYTHTERQFTFAIGTRLYFLKPLTIGFSMRNCGDFTTGNFSSIGFTGDFSLPVNEYEIVTTIGWRPSGAIALSSTPAGAVCRIFTRRSL
jgi:hypothetical protein